MAHSLLFSFRKRHPGSRTSTSASVTLAAVVLAGVGACYTGPINMPPFIQIVDAPLTRGGVATFTADVSDPNNDAVTVAWTHASGLCTRDAPMQSDWMTGASYNVIKPDTDGDFCVWATARDEHGATTPADPKQVHPTNGNPDVVLNVALEFPEKRFPPPTFPLYRSIRLDASGSDDAENDELGFEWKLVGGPNLELPFRDCAEGGSSSVRCLTPREPGTYKVKVTVRDAHDGVSDAIETLVVNPDQLPCLEKTDPPLTATPVPSRPDEMRKIVVEEVADDGDPLPFKAPDLGAPTFRWFVGRKGSPLQMMGVGVYHEIPPFAYNVGDQVQVRVEVLDRNTEEAKTRFSQCGDQSDTCGPPGCIQRMTWLVTYDK